MNLDLEHAKYEVDSKNAELLVTDNKNKQHFLKKINHKKSKILSSLGDNIENIDSFDKENLEFFQYFADRIAIRDNDIKNKILTATIYKIKGNDVIVDMGLKNYGKLNKEELKIGANSLNVKVGDKLPVLADSIDAKFTPYIKTSWEKARRIELWEQLDELRKNKTIIYGSIQSETRGGYIANIMGIKAFVPGSHVDFRPPEKDALEKMKFEEQPFLIVSMERDDKKNNIVISRREVLNLERMKIKDCAIEKIKVGDVLSGVVKNIAPYGCFINLKIPGMEDASVDGLLHINDISWSKISHPSEVLSIGSEIKVVVIGLSVEDKKISLGVKQLSESPWKGLSERLIVGSKVKGVIKNATDYGYFVDLECGVEGLVHLSEVSWSKKNPGLSIGQEVEVMVLLVDEEKSRISLSIKQCLENPWKKFAETQKVNQIIKAKIKKIIDFGLFIDLGFDIEGLVHVSDLNWDSDEANKMLTKFKIDEVIQMKILSIDINKGRVALGLKQLENDFFQAFLNARKIGDIVKCKINNTWNDKIEVLIFDAQSTLIIDGLSNLPEDFESEKQVKYLKDAEIDVKIIEIDPSIRKLVLSARI
jgi:small subunit ribosomal protein S1